MPCHLGRDTLRRFQHLNLKGDVWSGNNGPDGNDRIFLPLWVYE